MTTSDYVHRYVYILFSVLFHWSTAVDGLRQASRKQNAQVIVSRDRQMLLYSVVIVIRYTSVPASECDCQLEGRPKAPSQSMGPCLYRQTNMFEAVCRVQHQNKYQGTSWTKG